MALKKINIFYILILLAMIFALLLNSISMHKQQEEDREQQRILNMTLKLIDEDSMKKKIIGKWQCIQDGPGFEKGSIIEFTENTMNLFLEMPYKASYVSQNHLIVTIELNGTPIHTPIEIIDNKTIKIIKSLHIKIE